MIDILLAGETLGTSANYILAVLHLLNARVTHVPSGQKLKPAILKKRFDVILFSDFASKDLPAESEKVIVQQVQSGAGFAMIGGWGSFSGPFGKWKNSLIESLLPVECSNKDDRTALQSGAWIRPLTKHPILRGLNFKSPPVICGLNYVRLKKSGISILEAQDLARKKIRFPLLVLSSGSLRTAAFMSDLAPHWCGGLPDWGGHHRTISLDRKISVEVGFEYIRFVSQLIFWLAKK